MLRLQVLQHVPNVGIVKEQCWDPGCAYHHRLPDVMFEVFFKLEESHTFRRRRKSLLLATHIENVLCSPLNRLPALAQHQALR